MTFAEKVRKLRVENDLSQAALAEAVGVTLRTVAGWETENRFPKKQEVYLHLAKALHCDVSFLMGEKESFVTQAAEQYGYRGSKEAADLVNEVSGLFAGGEMADEDMDAFMFAIQQAYFDAKKRNKKYTPHKYLRDSTEAN